MGERKSLFTRFLGRRVDPAECVIFALFPNDGLRKGDHVLVEGVRHRISYVRLRWEGRRWTIKSLRVKEVSR